MSNEMDTTPEIREEGEKPNKPSRKLVVQATLHETVDQAYAWIETEPYKFDFFSPENLVTHLNLMKFNPNLEWYNTLLLYGFQDFSNTSYVAKTLDLWLNELKDEALEKSIQKTEINLLCPSLNQDEEQDRFEWHLIPFYFITTVEAGATEELYLPIHAMLEIFDIEKNQMILEPGWQNRFVQKYVEQFRFIQFEDEATKQFYCNALLFIFQDELHCPERIELVGTTQFTDPLGVYRRLHRLVANLPQALLVFLQNLEQTNARFKQLNLKRTPKSRVSSKIIQMMKGKIS